MLILPLMSHEACLENSGGKGASLARLAQLGLPVPPGFLITTAAYRRFVAENNLPSLITASLDSLSTGHVDRLEQASSLIRRAFSAGELPQEIKEAVEKEYRTLDPQNTGVAVRSSATTEDLPELSFAGQQDTYLNVIGEAQLYKAIIDCWSSLWTARAIAYRLSNAVPHQDVALAVVVQQMVFSDVSGVLFTANPLTGLLSEAVINAAFGLGEALVAGQVEPDHYVVDASSGKIRSLRLGAKRVVIRGKAGGGVERVNTPRLDDKREETLLQDGNYPQTLSADQVFQLVTLCHQIQDAYGAPQDIEWAFANGELFILQSRPITSLFPIPCISFDPLIVWASFGAVQGVVGPITPLGQEAIQRVVLGMGKRLHVHVSLETQDLFVVAGERVWTRISDVIRHPIGNRIMNGFLGFIEPGIRQIVKTLITDPRLGAGQGRIKIKTILRLARFFLPIVVQALWTMLCPAAGRRRFDAALEAYLETVRIPPGKDGYERLANIANFLESQGGLADALPTLFPRFIPAFAPAMASLNLIDHLLPNDESNEHGFSMLTLEMTRGLPRNVTTEMDLALWETATILRGDSAAAGTFRTTDSTMLAASYLEGSLSPLAQSAIGRFLERYGVRGVGEIDLGQPRWREDPTPVMDTLKSYMQIPPQAAPDVLFKKGAQAAGEAIERMVAEVRRQRGGWIKAKLLRAAARRVRLLLGARESPKFYAVRAMGIVREALLAAGAEMVSSGVIDRRDDLFFLHVSELAALSRREDKDWKALVSGRRQAYNRELRRRQVPRILLSDGRAFYEGLGAESDEQGMIIGSPVSPGMVEGEVRVVFDPRNAGLQPGEILVCPGTDPAWTPLFVAAGGLIMEVGGMMTHGSVVAREYGIPAVVSVHQATRRLKDGQRIRLDGTNGRIMIL